jgi:hypothetical protein
MPTSYEHQFDTLLTRFNFHFTKSQIKQVMETKSLSKERLKNDVLASIAGHQGLQNKIGELGLLALQLDTRQIEVFCINDDRSKTLLNSLFTTVQKTSEAIVNDAFPFPVEDHFKLNALKTGTVYPVLSDAVTMGAHLYNRLIVCTVVDKEVEDPVPAAHLSQKGLQQQNTNTTYTMKRKVRTQLFHVIYWCSDLSKLILSVDRNVLSLTAAQDQLFFLRSFLMAQGMGACDATNVFSAIEPLYNSVDGYVTKLGHVVTLFAFL